MPGRGVRRVARPLFWVAIVLFVIPTIDTAVRGGPIAYNDANWRFMFSLRIAQESFVPMVGLALGALIASAVDNRRALGLISVLSALLGVVLLRAFMEVTTKWSANRDNLNFLGSSQVDVRLRSVRLAVVFIGCVWLTIAGLRGISWRAIAKRQGR